MKRWIALLMTAVLAVALVGCGAPKSGGEGGNIIGRTSKDQDGYFEGKVGDTMRTEFFDFKVLSVEVVDQYAGFTPEEGNKLLDVQIQEKNTFGEDLPMFVYDFQLQWGEGDDDFANPKEGVRDESLMPEEFTLAAKESKEYHVLFEVPQDITDFDLVYLEEFDDDSIGDFFAVKFQA